MRVFLTPLLHLQRFFIPALLILLAWAVWRLVFRRDRAVGLALYACLLVVVDGFYNTGIYLPGLAQGSIRYSEVCALLLFLQSKPASQEPSRSSAIPFLFGLYFLLLFIAALRADPLAQGIMDFRRLIVPQMLAFYLAIRGFDTPDDYRRFLIGTLVLVMIVGVFCFWDVFFDINVLHSDTLLKPEYFHNRKLGRFGSILLNPNLLGAFVILYFPPLLALFIDERNGWRRGYLLVALLALLFCLIQTQSRAPLAAFAGVIALFVAGPVSGLSRGRRFAAVAVAGMFLALLIPGFMQHATERFTTIGTEESDETISRASVWRYTRRLIAQKPLLGVGFGESQFLAAMDATDYRARYGARSLDNPHNSYLQAAVYAGLPAVGLFVLGNLLLLARSWRSCWSPAVGRGSGTHIFGLTVGLSGFLVCIYPDMHLFTATVAPLYWLMTGLLLSFSSKELGLKTLDSASGSLSDNSLRARRLGAQTGSSE